MKAILMSSLSELALPLQVAHIAVTVALAASCWWLYRTLQDTRSRWSELVRGSGGSNLEVLLERHLKDRLEIEKRLAETTRKVNRLEKRVHRAKRHLGLVRYDAFEDVAGGQSFALALYDDDGNGAIISGLVGRNECRVYCKPLTKGASERPLSDEERRAILKAVERPSEPIVSR